MSKTAISIDVDPTELPTIFRQVTKMAGPDTWRRRVEALESERDSKPLWRHFLRERYGLEMAFGSVHRHLRSSGRISWPPKSIEEFRFLSFAAGITRVHATLSPRGQKKLVGALCSSLEKGFGLGPLAFEMKTAAHLLARGYNLEFHDLEGEGGHDFTATRGQQKIEVECKHISGDVGRKIPLRELYELGSILHPALELATRNVDGGLLTTVVLPDRLTGNTEHQKKLLSRISAVLFGKADTVDDDLCSVVSQPFSLDGSPFSGAGRSDISTDRIQSYLSEKFSIENANVLVNCHPNRAAIVVWVSSKKDDTVLRSIYGKLKEDAKRQFSGTLPACLCVHLAAVTDNGLLRLAEADQSGVGTGLQRMVNLLLDKRPHLHTVAVMTDGELQVSRNVGPNGEVQNSIREVGPSYVFKNVNHADARAPLDSVFV